MEPFQVVYYEAQQITFVGYPPNILFCARDIAHIMELEDGSRIERLIAATTFPLPTYMKMWGISLHENIHYWRGQKMLTQLNVRALVAAWGDNPAFMRFIEKFCQPEAHHQLLDAMIE